MSDDFYIMYNPLTFNLMDMVLNKKSTSLNVISYLTGLDTSLINETNYIDYLDFDLKKHREGMVETFAIESYAALYIGNQIAKADPNRSVIQADGKRRTIYDIISSKGNKPRAVFITSMSSNFATTVAVAIVLNYAKIPVIIGGIHISTSRDDVDIFIKKYCPHPELISQVNGPGDSFVISEIIEDLNKKKIKKTYTGKVTIEDNYWKPLKNVTYLPPLYIKMLDRIPLIGKYLAKKMKIIPVSPYLGCPFSCNFCSISSLPLNQRKLTIRSTDDFLNELEYLQEGGNFNSRLFFFLPDNLLLGWKKLDPILDGIIERKLQINFAAQISIDIALNEKLLKKLRLAGATHFFIGLESLDINNLNFIGKHIVSDIKKTDISVKEYYRNLIRKIQNCGISVHGAFILGLPYDYYDSFNNNTGNDIANFCIENHIGLQPCSLTNLPGSQLFNEAQKNGTWLYGKQGTLEYLKSLCLSDLTETNRLPPNQLDNSPLKVAIMAFESINVAGTNLTAFKNAIFMMKKSYLNPTNRGKESFKEKLIDSMYSFVSQLIVNLYKDHGEKVAYSANGIKGGLERLYDMEKNIATKAYFKEYIKKFKQESRR